MNYLRLGVVALVVLATVPTPAAALVEGSPKIEGSFADNTVDPGEETTLQLQLLNRGAIPDDDEDDVTPEQRRELTTADDLTVTVRSGSAPVEVETGTQIVGQLPQGAAPSPLAVPVTVAEDAAPGTYEMDVVLRYNHTSEFERDGDTETDSVTRTIPVKLRVRPAARFAVVATESDVRAGATETYTVTAENVGSAVARDATVTLQSSNPALTFEGTASATRQVGEWEPGERRTVSYEVTAASSAEQQRYAMTATVEYTNHNGNPATSQGLSVGVVPAPEQSFAVSNVSGTLAVGSEGVLRGTVTNTGEQRVTNAVVVYASESSTVTPVETEAPVGALDPGESADFQIPLEVATGAEDGPRQFSVAVQYRNADDQQRRSDTIDVRTRVAADDPEFDLTVEGGTVSAGETTKLRVTVTNDENETLRDITAKLFANDPLSASFDEAFVEELAPGESATVTFEIRAGTGALPKTYPLSMDFQYDDSSGDTLTSDTYRVAVEVIEPDGGGGLPVVPVLAVVAVLVVVGVGVYLYRR